MFTFTKLFWHNTQNQKARLFGIAFIGFAILLLLTILAMSPYNLLLQVWQMSMLTGQQNLTTLILMMVGAILLTIFLFAMLIFPFFVGVISAIHHSILNTTKARWKDLFRAFKKGVWGKTVILGILTLLFIVVTAIIYALVNACGNDISHSTDFQLGERHRTGTRRFTIHRQHPDCTDFIRIKHRRLVCSALHYKHCCISE
ncbi:hypothetical protein [Staphylococcus pseudintermedius]|uniref:hypothetical protein n=1 Tax=Staphylococcus pseudintermedius TaxID=283734 RepID=UPI001E502E6D|nr:hypothetical protein [Staphylococcus pseudintermedius]